MAHKIVRALALVIALTGFAAVSDTFHDDVAAAARGPWTGAGTGVDTTGLSVDVRNPLTKEAATFIAVRNIGATNSLKVSFDGGTNFITLKAGESYSTACLLGSIYLKAGAATTDYEYAATGGTP